VTFGFVARDRGSAGLRGARFQAVFSESSYVGIGLNPWGMLPHLLPQERLEAVFVANLGGVGTREKVEKLLDRLSEDELAAEYRRLRQAVGGKRAVDDWGDLERFSARASRGVLRHMTEDEEKAGLSWEEFRPQ
jgi:hypothetical protein